MSKVINSKKNEGKPKTLVTLLLDRSGSMNFVRQQTIDAVNAWTGELRGSGLDIRFSQIHFDYHLEMCLEKLHVGKKIAEVPELTLANFQPRGMTPLIDAAVDTIRAVETSTAGKKNLKVIIAIQTDGSENCSSRYNWNDLKALIDERQGAGWEFVFMGAGINAYEQGAMMGIARSKTIAYGMDANATREAFRSTASNTVAYASGAKADLSYSPLQKAAVGDHFEGAQAAPGAFPDHGYQRFGYIPARSLELRPSHIGSPELKPDQLAQINRFVTSAGFPGVNFVERK